MIREIVKIDEDLCTGCGDCVPGCHEGALQIIDGKARLISELMCDGLGACLGHCPEGAITIEKREAEEYDEITVIKQMVPKGKNTIVAHLKHLKDHDEHVYMKQALEYLRAHESETKLNVTEIMKEVHSYKTQQEETVACDGGCLGSAPVSFEPQNMQMAPEATGKIQSELQQWPVQMHLINPAAAYFHGQDLVLAADCVAFSHGDFHRTFLKGKKLVIACPKLDSGKEIYIEKLRRLIDDSRINTLSVIMMEVPCCGGLGQMVKIAQSQAQRKVPVKEIIIGIKGDVLDEQWV